MKMTSEFGPTSTADEVLAGVDLKGKRFLVTGASSGIGLEIARALSARGAHVVGAVRNLAKAEQAAARVHDAAAAAGGSLEFIQLDLASLRSVCACANRLLSRARRFNVVIANAGIMAPPFGRTVDGFEVQFATNHLGHFALIDRIDELLSENGRLVVLSSLAHRVADVDLDDPNFERQEYDPLVAYGRSKTANALFAVEFDRRHRHRGIRAASVMPGNGLTELPRHFAPGALQGLLETVDKARAEAGLPPKALKTIGQAAATPVWAAVIADKDEIGGRYLEDCAIAPVNDTPNPFADGVRSYALDPANAKEFWAMSEELIGAAWARLEGAA